MDRNKTKLTHQVTEAAIKYLDEFGFKPLETEVPVCAGWAADIAGVCVATETEAVALKLIPRKPRSQPALETWNATFKSLPSPLTAVVEVKTSVGDFRRDRKWQAVAPTDLRYVALPHDLIPSKDWPSGWGILLVQDEVASLVRPPSLERVSMEQRLNVVLQVAMRRDNITRHARLREIEKEGRIEFNQKETLVRWTKSMRAVLVITRGGRDERWGSQFRHSTLDDCLNWFQISGLPRDLYTELQRLWDAATSDAPQIDESTADGGITAAGLSGSGGGVQNVLLS